jgi:hypothetical protein
MDAIFLTIASEMLHRTACRINCEFGLVGEVSNLDVDAIFLTIASEMLHRTACRINCEFGLVGEVSNLDDGF